MNKTKTETEEAKLYDEIHIGFYVKPGEEITNSDRLTINAVMGEVYTTLADQLKRRGLSRKLKVRISK